MTSIASFLRGAAPAALVVAAMMASNASAQSCNPKSGKSFKASFDFYEQLAPTTQCPISALAQAPVFQLKGQGSANRSIGSIGVSSQNCVVMPSQQVPNGLDFFGPRFVLTTADGDQLIAQYSGTASPALSTPAGGLYNLAGTYTIIGGTGRFAGAQGCGTLTGSEAVSFTGLPTGVGRISLQGVIAYGSSSSADSDD